MLAGHMGAQHFVLHEEEEAFSDWINKRLAKDKDVTHYLPLAVIMLHNITLLLNFYICIIK